MQDVLQSKDDLPTGSHQMTKTVLGNKRARSLRAVTDVNKETNEKQNDVMKRNNYKLTYTCVECLS